MSTLAFTDLNRDEELLPSDMSQVAGGTMNCAQAIGAAGFYIALSNIYGSMGMTSQSAAAAGKAQGVIEAGCPG